MDICALVRLITLSLPVFIMNICGLVVTFESADEIQWCRQ